MKDSTKLNDENLFNMLFENGCYWGHQSRYRNPKMKQYIWGKHNGIDVIDLRKTVPKLKIALNEVERIVENGGKIVFVGTKQFASAFVKQYADQVNMPYVNRRWLGGTLTNFKTIKQSVKKLVYLESMLENNKFDELTKKERLMKERNCRDLNASLGGLRNLQSLPDLLFVLDAKHDSIAVKEANKLGIPVIAILDTNTSEDGIKFSIPGNDDSMRSIELYLSLVARSVDAGLAKVKPEKQVLSQHKKTAAAKKPKPEAKRVVTVSKKDDEAKAAKPKVVTVKKTAESKPAAKKTTKTVKKPASKAKENSEG
jgi:small subunit ribosomal protein S2